MSVQKDDFETDVNFWIKSPNDTLTDGAEEFYEIQENEPTVISESPGSDEDPESSTPNPEIPTLWQLAESITSITSSLIPQTEEKCDAQNCENCPGKIIKNLTPLRYRDLKFYESLLTAWELKHKNE